MIPDKHGEINKKEINDRGENETFIDDLLTAAENRMKALKK